MEDLLISCNERVLIHLRREIEGEIHIVAGEIILDKAALILQSLIEPRAPGSIQNAHHGSYDPAVLDEIDLGLENCSGIAVKPDNEPAHHFHAVILNTFY